MMSLWGLDPLLFCRPISSFLMNLLCIPRHLHSLSTHLVFLSLGLAPTAALRSSPRQLPSQPLDHPLLVHHRPPHRLLLLGVRSLKSLDVLAGLLPELGGLSLHTGEPGLGLLVQAVVPLRLRAFLETRLIEAVVVADRGEVLAEGLEILLQGDQLPL
jgi:hypothetical protein